MAEKHGIIRVIYLYLFALVGLFIFIFSAVSGIGAVLDRYVFPQEFVDYNVVQPMAVDAPTKPVIPTTEEKTKNLEEQKQNFEKQQNNDFRRRVNQAVPGIIIGYLLWSFHWKWIRKDRES